MKDNEIPTLLLSKASEVDVVRWWAGNHTADNNDGAAIETGPAKPFNMWPQWINL